MPVTPSTWTPGSWRELDAGHQPTWPDERRAEAARAELRAMPPLVFAGEARKLLASLGEVAEGRAFLLQAGDCAESFHEFHAVNIREKLRILLQMAAVLTYGGTLPVVKVGRIAGQFGKPRSSPTETIGEVELPSFFGHLINDDTPTVEARMPDPARMVRAYHQSAATLNLLRAFTKGGFADINRVHEWNQEFVASSAEGMRYEALAVEIERALRFMAACGIDLEAEQRLHQTDVWTSHEGLVLDYEEGLSRTDSLSGEWYACSAHMLWIGERTRQLDGAHVEFFRGIKNPIGCKIGPTATVADVLGLCEAVNPDQVPGRLTLITRMGVAAAPSALPPLFAAVREAAHPVVWACDPMHANVFTSESGLKTRSFDDILREIEIFFAACHDNAVWPGGVHLEFTGEDVTECIGGSEDVREEELNLRYMTLCDPRLNARQSLDLAFRIAELMRQPNGGSSSTS